MAKKSFFERIGLVESNGPDLDTALANFDTEYNFNEVEEVLPAVDLGDEDFLTVDEVYEKAGLADLSRSIFKVDEFSKVLPDSLPTDAKRTSVVGILAASNLPVDVLVEDANGRVAALKSVKQVTNENTANIVSENEIRIAELLAEVDNLKQQNNDRKAAQEKQDEILETEVEKLTGIKKFISPESV